MAEGAATLVDRVLPRVPVRQWVLTLPSRLRDRLAWDHGLCRAVLGIHARSVEAANAGELKRVLEQEGATVVVVETLAYAVGLGGGHFGTSSSDPIEIDSFSEKEFAQLVSPAGTEVVSPEGVSSGCHGELVITG